MISRTLFALLAMAALPGLVAAGTPADSLSLHSRARAAQESFERTRSFYAPIVSGSASGSCDEVIGRMCLRYLGGLPDDWVPPDELPRVVEGREDLLDILSEVNDSLPGDGWILGQRVAYLGEADRWAEARAVASRCDAEGWWCLALQGTAAHFLGETVEAERLFAGSLASMPEGLSAEWGEVHSLVDFALARRFMEASSDSISLQKERLWVLADPLFLLPGNEARTEHYARHTLAQVRAEGENAYGFRWGEDLHEIFVRYGPEVAFERPSGARPGEYPIPMVGRFDPNGRGFFPIEPHFLAPTEIAPGEWRTDDRAVRSRYALRAAPRIGGVELHQARFRRGEEGLLVLGWTLGDGAPSWFREEAGGTGEDGSAAGAGHAEGSIEPPEILTGGLFLYRVDRGRLTPITPLPLEVQVSEDALPRGVVAAPFPVGRHLLSLEFLDSERKRGWRARHGIVFPPSVPGRAELSDLLLLGPEPTPPIDRGEEEASDSLERHLERTLPTTVLQGDSVEVAWEVYGLAMNERVEFTLSVVPERAGALRRVLQLLRLASPDPPVELSWVEEGSQNQDPQGRAPFFRRIALDLSTLPLGSAKIVLRMRQPGSGAEAVSEVAVERSPAVR